jgi:hypothetical protein
MTLLSGMLLLRSMRLGRQWLPWRVESWRRNPLRPNTVVVDGSGKLLEVV